MGNIFNKLDIFHTIFYNIQSVTEYGSYIEFNDAEPERANTWKIMAENRYAEELKEKSLDTIYLEKACLLPEFSKIVGITYATVDTDSDGSLKRNLKYIMDNDEIEIIKKFIDVLNIIMVDAHNAIPSFVPIMCGHNIIGHDIPLLIKRIVKHRDILKAHYKVPIVPLILKHYLKSKPWESLVIDTVVAWKFNGSDYISLNLIAETIGLKKTTTLMPKEDVNALYWSDWKADEVVTKERMISNQSANFTNLAIQLVNELRVL